MASTPQIVGGLGAVARSTAPPRAYASERAAGADLRDVRATCLHCGLPTEGGDAYCCLGCEAVHQGLVERGLERFYALRGTVGAPVIDAITPPELGWVDAVWPRIESGDALRRTALEVQGISCAACVWLLSELFRRASGSRRILINVARGTVDLVATPDFDLRAFAAEARRFGYTLGPRRAARAEGVSRDLLWRLGVTVALAGNAMLFAIAIYAGLDSGPLYELFQTLIFGLATASVAIGGSVFFRTAIRAWQKRIAHLDVPIAIGIVAAYAGSVYAYVVGSSATYFDTLAVFIALMLAGRMLRERVLASNRARIMQAPTLDALVCDVIIGGRVERTPVSRVRAGDALLVAKGELVPVDSTLESGEANISLEWIDGESRPRGVLAGELVPAGAHNQSDAGIVVRARSTTEASRVAELLSTLDVRREGAGADSPTARFAWSTLYVVSVTVLGVLTFAYWGLWREAWPRAFEAATAVLVVSCPCAVGLANPLAEELALGWLRRQGLYIRTSGFFRRLRCIRRVVFDKTGTLTLGRLGRRDRDALVALGEDDRNILFNLVVQSRHPRACALREAMDSTPGRHDARLLVIEQPGLGIEAEVGGETARLGRPEWVDAEAATASPPDELWYQRGSGPILRFDWTEEVRPGAVKALGALARRGLDVHIASGDAPSRTLALAERVGVDASRVRAKMTPRDKDDLVRSLGEGTLMLGDGLNDAPALRSASLAGTPAVDRPWLPSSADFYLTTPSVEPIELAFSVGDRLRRAVRANWVFFGVYNALVVSFAMAGWMSPLACAIVMPLSSALVLGMTAYRLRDRRTEVRAWK